MIILWNIDNPAKLYGLLVKNRSLQVGLSGFLNQFLFYIIFFASCCYKISEIIGSVSSTLKSPSNKKCP